MPIGATSFAIKHSSWFIQDAVAKTGVLVLSVEFDLPVPEVQSANAVQQLSGKTWLGNITHTPNSTTAIFRFKVDGYQLAADGITGSGDFVFTVGIVPAPGGPPKPIKSPVTPVQPIEINPCDDFKVPQPTVPTLPCPPDCP